MRREALVQGSGGLREARQQIKALHEQLALGCSALAALVGQPLAAQAIALPQLAVMRGRQQVVGWSGIMPLCWRDQAAAALSSANVPRPLGSAFISIR